MLPQHEDLLAVGVASDLGAHAGLATAVIAGVVVLAFAVTVTVDLVTVVGAGAGAAIFLALRSVAHHAHLDQVPLGAGDHTAEDHELMSERIVAYRLAALLSIDHSVVTP